MIPEVPTRVKQPAETRVFTFDFSAQPEIRDNAETISSAGTVSSDTAGLTLGTPAIASGSQKVNVSIAGGTTGVNYKITLTGVTTSGGAILEGEFNLLVRNL